MSLLRARTKKEKMELFVKLADEDGNGMLSFEEIKNLARMSLETNF